MYTKKQYSEPSIFSLGNIKTILGIVLSMLVLLLALLVIMLKTNITIFGLTATIPNDDELLDLSNNSLVFMKSINQNKLPPRGELVTFNDENQEVLVRVINSEELDTEIIYYVTGGGFIEHRIFSTDLVNQGSFLIPNLGIFAAFLVTPAGLLVCLGIPLVIILVLLLMHFMDLPKKNGDYTFSNVNNQGFFADATVSNNKRQRGGMRSKTGYEDPYAEYSDPNQWQNQQNQQNANNNYYQQPNMPNNQNELFNEQYQDSQYSQNNSNNKNSNPRKRPTIESILADVTGKNYNFDDDENYENYENYDNYENDNDLELDYQHQQNQETMPLNYTKPTTVNTDPEANNLIVTREFFIAELQPEEVTKAHEYTRGVGFQANLNDYEKNNFNIDGIDVNVDSNNIQLAITEDNDSDIFITVTEEFTNVVVNKENLETSFALFKDDEDEKNKVIIRKKQLS